jgi:hypothetical protein
MISKEAMELVKRSAIKHEKQSLYPPKKRGETWVPKVKEKPMEIANKQPKMGRPRTKEGPPPKNDGHIPAQNGAVNYVNAERAKEGLPADPKVEAINTEEKLLKVELRKGGSIASALDSYLDTCTFSRKIVNENWANRVAKELVMWINAPRVKGKEPYKITEFLREKGIYHGDFYRLSQQYEILRQATDYALQALGDIRERNMLENVWNTNVGMFMQGHYDKDWRKEQERREAAKVTQAAASGTDFKAIITDMLTPVAPTEEVRLKVERDTRVRDRDR